MNITYFHRSIQSGISINKVSRTYIDEIKKNNNININEFYLPFARASLFSIIKNLFFAYKHRNKEGINHITGDVHYLSYVLPKNRTITTVHDLGFLDSGFSNYNILKKQIVKFLYINSLKRNKYIICVSEFTKQSVIKHARIEAKNVIVIHNPLSPIYKYFPKEFNKKCPIILHIGTMPIRKNLETVIPALRGVNCLLRIIGEMNHNQKELARKNNVKYTNSVALSEEELYKEYKSCDLVSFPSLYEGFGMIIIEGQAVGRPIITSNIEPIIEVSGSAAHFTENPLSIKELKDSFLKVINDDEYREYLIKAGLNNIKKFNVDIIKDQYLNIYHKIYKK